LRLYIPLSRTPLAADELRDAIYILVYTGLRAGELLAVRRCDVDLAQGLLHVRHSLTHARELGPTKTPSSVRDLVLDEHVDNAFRGQLERMLARGQGRPEDFLWTHKKKGGPLGYTSLRCLFVRARKAAGLDAGVVLHSTRHTYASWAILEAEARVEFLSKQMGHKNISETWDTYFHFFLRAEHAEKTRERLSATIHW
jgi:integrase